MVLQTSLCALSIFDPTTSLCCPLWSHRLSLSWSLLPHRNLDKTYDDFHWTQTLQPPNYTFLSFPWTYSDISSLSSGGGTGFLIRTFHSAICISSWLFFIWIIHPMLFSNCHTKNYQCLTFIVLLHPLIIMYPFQIFWRIQFFPLTSCHYTSCIYHQRRF